MLKLLFSFKSSNTLKTFSDDFNFSRKKKHPDVAYRSHEFFDSSLAGDGIHSGSGNRISESVDGSDKVG